MHLTETCDADAPHVITHVATTPAPVIDEKMIEDIHADLERTERLPLVHLVDTGYVTAQILVRSCERFGVEIIGPPLPDSHWQAKIEGGFDLSQFHIDWDQQQAICPQECRSQSWKPFLDQQQHSLITIQFSNKYCSTCKSRLMCIHSEKPHVHRTLTVRPREQHEALQAARARQRTPEFAHQYALRAGIEATISQGVRAFDLRRSRSIGKAKTHLQHLGIAAAINLVRIGAWLNGDDLAPTRVSAYQRLCSAL